MRSDFDNFTLHNNDWRPLVANRTRLDGHDVEAVEDRDYADDATYIVLA